MAYTEEVLFPALMGLPETLEQLRQDHLRLEAQLLALRIALTPATPAPTTTEAPASGTPDGSTAPVTSG